MFPPRISILLAALLHATQVSMATSIDLLPRSGPLQRRDSTSGLVYENMAYYINITLGGSSYSVLVDTGRWAISIDGVQHVIQLFSTYNFQC